MMPVKLRSLEAQRYFIFKPMSRLKLSERTQLFSSPTCPKFYDIYRWNTRISVSKTWYLYHALWTFHLSLISDVMVTRFSKMAVLLFTKGSFLYYEHQVDSTLSSEEKFISWLIFMSKLRGPVHGLSYLQVSCAFGVLHIYFKLYLI